jgi:hypothetical protein
MAIGLTLTKMLLQPAVVAFFVFCAAWISESHDVIILEDGLRLSHTPLIPTAAGSIQSNLGRRFSQMDAAFGELRWWFKIIKHHEPWGTIWLSSAKRRCPG